MNKLMKKLTALALAFVMVFALCAVANAADNTITIQNADKGTTYTAYKVFDVTNNGNAYKVAAGDLHDAVASSDLFAVSSVPSSGYYTVTQAEGASDADIISWLTSHKDLFENAGAFVYQDDGTATLSVQDYGYYYVTTSSGAAVTITNSAKNATIKDKLQKGPGDPEKTVADSDAAIGETVSFTVTYDATNYIQPEGAASASQVKSYKIVDTYKNLRIRDTDTVTVKVSGTEVTGLNPTVVNSEDGTGGTLTIEIPWANADGANLYSVAADAATIPVEITYTAEVTGKALNTAANKVSVGSYGTIDATGDPIEPPKDTPEVTVTDYDLTINKVDDAGAALAGAKFSLTKVDTGALVSVVDEGNGVYRVADSTDATTTTELVSPASGVITVKGLDNASYTLAETEAPAGYNKAADQTVNPKENAPVQVVNNAGAELPETGGMGTTIFYIVGAVLVLGAGVVLITRRRMAVK